MMKQWDVLWINVVIETCEPNQPPCPQGAIAIQEGRIAWLGPLSELPSEPYRSAKETRDMQGALVTPGLIDCHTHLVYAGDRANEFAMRLNGATYEEIAQAGGGIQSTVKATRQASEDELLTQALFRAKALMQSGVTTLEIKSGYGLDWETEMKLLRVMDRLASLLPLTIQKTFLGAHTIPSEYRAQPESYVDMICHEMIPGVAREKLAEAVDVFCETIGFSLAQTERIFQAAKQHGLAVKCHAEQLSDSCGAELAVQYGALSVDHLEHLSSKGVRALAGSSTVAVLLPFAYYFLRETKMPPIAALRQHGVPMAVASDCNPGTSPVLSMLCVLNMACTIFRLTPQEALHGVTRHAAAALGLADSIGTLTVGKWADMAVWKATHPNELVYYMGADLLQQLVRRGQTIFSSPR